MSSSPPVSVSNEQIIQGLAAFSIRPNSAQIDQIRAYTSLLLKWNAFISLTTVTEASEIIRRHFGESMYATKILPVENCRLADVGTGAGFPGLALKIAVPEIHLVLIESNKKKSTFLHEMVRALELPNVEIIADRFEAVRPEHLKLDIVTSRAVGEFKPLLRWSAKALAARGHIMLWLGADDSTRVSSDASWTWQPAARLPDSQRRFILVGRPVRPVKADR